MLVNDLEPRYEGLNTMWVFRTFENRAASLRTDRKGPEIAIGRTGESAEGLYWHKPSQSKYCFHPNFSDELCKKYPYYFNAYGAHLKWEDYGFVKNFLKEAEIPKDALLA